MAKTKRAACEQVAHTCLQDAAYQSGGLSQEISGASTDPSVRGSTRLSESSGLGEGLAEEGEHAVGGNVAEGRQLQRVVAAMKREGAGICVVAAEGGEHLLGQRGKERRVVLAVTHEGDLPRRL